MCIQFYLLQKKHSRVILNVKLLVYDPRFMFHEVSVMNAAPYLFSIVFLGQYELVHYLWRKYRGRFVFA